MAFSKTFPRNIEGSNYPRWEEVFLKEVEEEEEEKKARKENIKLMEECIDDARDISKDRDLKNYQTDIMKMAISLFEKRASHSVYWKERKAKEKFDNRFKEKK